MKNEERESVQPVLKANQDQKEHLKPARDIGQLDIVHPGGSKNTVSDVRTGMNVSSETNMEAPITSDDVMRAGGFGARDDIGCFLPVASDSTDFEASLRKARGYEDPQENIGKPGLGWKGARKPG
ncbi:Mediator of RNA polymerase II transcription subunit 23 [Heracleum sosnowskyi]|uniref:Mediator of RNA polymerase II transcription subunit 23 n=1 Tax=Heracleum sosnowskyi TaxID=360622 RepID=A0AAD8HFJ4_9APIA|nr:Mediator of RNA polymerase II transcription subunit 23 [Heracleum sosnowskyi]